jgi:hypothetical protein
LSSSSHASSLCPKIQNARKCGALLLLLRFSKTGALDWPMGWVLRCAYLTIFLKMILTGGDDFFSPPSSATVKNGADEME